MKRKYVKTFESYVHSLKEGIDWSDSSDADIEELAAQMEEYDDNPKAAEAKAKELLKSANPFPLTGNVKKDALALIKLAKDTLKGHGIELDDANAEIDSENFGNEIRIPIKGVDTETARLETNLDYSEMAYSTGNKKMVAEFSFYTFEEGNGEFFDMKNPAAVKNAVADVKMWINHNPKNESWINESKGGPKVQKFLKFAGLEPADLVYLADAEGGQGLHKGWHDAKKKLKLTDANAVICFTDAVEDYYDMIDAARNSGLNFLELDETGDADNGGIIFDVNQ